MEEKAMNELDRIIELLKRLPPDKQRLVGDIIKTWGNEAGMDTASGYASPADNIERWATRMTMESKSGRTIEMYKYYAAKFLEAYPKPTRLDAQQFLASQLAAGTSPTAAKGMQKSITSLFKYLSEEKLWPEDITAGLKGIKVPRPERDVPPLADVEKVLGEGGWGRKKAG